MEHLVNLFPRVMSGMVVTLQVTAVALLFGVIIGLLACMGKMSKHFIPRAIAKTYIEIIRGTPILVQALFFYFGIPVVIKFLVTQITGDTSFLFPLNPMMAGMIVCSLNSGAYVAEIFRAGIQSVDKGQMEAARSLGMPHKLAMKKIILPQAIRTILPSLGNEFVVLIKETSILSIIGVTEITKAGQLYTGATFTPFSTYLCVACVYFVLTFTASRFVNLLERRMAVSD